MIKKLFTVHHSHTDIGYTDIQPAVFEDHVRFIDDVLNYCKETDNYPEESKFRWTCETSWMVKNYLQNRPERTKEFIKRVKEERIEVTAFYLKNQEGIKPQKCVKTEIFIMGCIPALARVQAATFNSP